MSRSFPGSTPRPVCVCCGKVYGQRNTHTEDIFVPDGERLPPYSGNHHVIREYVINADHWRPRPDVEQPKSHSPEWYKPYTEATHIKGDLYRRETWDGESYFSTQCAPFCGNTCAIAFAKAAYAEFGARYKLVKKVTA